MPDLPRVWIDDQQAYDRVLAAMPGSNNAEKVAGYRKMVRQMLRRVTIQYEQAQKSKEVPDLDVSDIPDVPQ